MNGGTSPRGYTIVEVMIFLAVSGVMFLVAASFISGKQARAEFQQGMNDVNTQVQQVINDVANGSTPSNSNFTCSAPADGGLDFTTTANTSGSNLGCVFLGKVIQFAVTDPNNNLDPSAYNIYTVAGRQFAANSTNDISELATSFNLAQPAAVAPPAVTGPRDLTQQDTLDWQLQVTKMTSTNTAGPTTQTVNINGIGFFTDFGGLSNGDQQSGSQTVQVVPIDGLNQVGEKETDMVTDIDNADTYLNVTANPDIVICFEGGANEYGSLTIGNGSAQGGSAQGQRLTTSMQISDSPIGSC